MNSWAEFRKGGGGGGWNWDGPQKGKGSARVKGRRVWKKWSHRDDKSNFRSTRLHGEGRRGEPLPIVAFYMQSKAKLWRAETPRWPAHCATCWPEASLYHRRSWVDTYFYLNVFLCPSSSTFPPPLFPLRRGRRNFYARLTIQRTFSFRGSDRDETWRFSERGKEPR